MPQITSLVVQRRNRGRVNVYIDGNFAFGLASILAATLHIGQELAKEEIALLQEKDAIEAAYEKCLNFLSYRPRSRQEVERYLAQKEVQDSTVEEVVARLERQHLIDDREFARFWVENRETFRPRGRYALQHELWQKGVSPDAVDAALVDLDENASAQRAAEKYARRLANLNKETYYKRLLGYLQRRGFGYGVSRRIVDQMWSQLKDEEGTNPD